MLGAFALGTFGPEASAMMVFGGASPVVQRDSAVQLVVEHRKVKKDGHKKKCGYTNVAPMVRAIATGMGLIATTVAGTTTPGPGGRLAYRESISASAADLRQVSFGAII